MSFFDELKRRNVVRVATAYVVAAWLIIQVVDTALRGIWLSEEHYRLFIMIVVIGFVPVVVLAWVFQLTPDGLVIDKDGGEAATSRDTARFIDRAIIVVLAIAVTYFVVERILPDESTAPTIAVLPFENVGSDPDHEVFVTAMTYEVRDLLTAIPELTVIARASTELAIQKYGRDIPALREALGVAHVLDGTVQAIGDRLRIDVQLIESRSQSNRWSQTFERDVADHYEIQDAIATEVVGHLKLNLVGSVPHAEPVDPVVLSLVTAARLLDQRQGNVRGQEMYDLLSRALEIDPDYVPALEWMLVANNRLGEEGFTTVEEDKRRFEAIKARIRELDPDNSYLLFIETMPISFAGQFEEAARNYTRAVEGSPNDSRLLRMSAVFARRLWKFDVSSKLLDRAVRVDPLCYRCLYDLSRLQYVMEDYEAAMATRQRYLELGKGGEFQYGMMLLLTGRIDEADEHFRGVEDNPAWYAAGLSMVLHSQGFAEESARHFETLKSLIGTDYPDYAALIDTAAWTGRIDEAFDAIYRQLEESPFMVTVIAQSPVLKPLHDDSRWTVLIDSLGVSPEAAAKIHFDPRLPD